MISIIFKQYIKGFSGEDFFNGEEEQENTEGQKAEISIEK